MTIHSVTVNSMNTIEDLPIKKFREFTSNEKTLFTFMTVKNTLKLCHWSFRAGNMSSLIEFSSALQKIYSISIELAKNSDLYTQDRTLSTLARLEDSVKYIERLSQNSNTTSQLIFDLGSLHDFYSSNRLKECALLYLEGEDITEEFVKRVIKGQEFIKLKSSPENIGARTALNNSVKLLSRLEAQLLLEGL